MLLWASRGPCPGNGLTEAVGSFPLRLQREGLQSLCCARSLPHGWPGCLPAGGGVLGEVHRSAQNGSRRPPIDDNVFSSGSWLKIAVLVWFALGPEDVFSHHPDLVV